MKQRPWNGVICCREHDGPLVRPTAVALAVVLCLFAGLPVQAQESAGGSASTAAVSSSPLPSAAPPPPATAPGLDLSNSGKQPDQPSVFRRWWFWAAVGAAAAATLAIVVVSTRGHAPPATDLGNQEFQP